MTLFLGYYLEENLFKIKFFISLKCEFVIIICNENFQN